MLQTAERQWWREPRHDGLARSTMGACIMGAGSHHHISQSSMSSNYPKRSGHCQWSSSDRLHISRSA